MFAQLICALEEALFAYKALKSLCRYIILGWQLWEVEVDGGLTLAVLLKVPLAQLAGRGCWWVMLLSVTLAMAQPEIAGSMWRWYSMRDTQNENYPEYSRHSPWIAETWWIVPHREAPNGDHSMGMLTGIAPHIQQKVKGTSITSCMSPPSSQFWKNDREESAIVFFCWVMAICYYKYSQLEIITTFFLLSSQSWHAEIWACGLVFRSPAGVFWDLPCKKM